MHIILSSVILLALGVALYRWLTRVPSADDPGDVSDIVDDPRIAAATLMVIVASAEGSLTPSKRETIVSLLSERIGLTLDTAHACLAAGERIAWQQRGDLAERLHQLRGPVMRGCSRHEREDLIDMLHAVAGQSAQRRIGVRDALGRFAASLVAVH
jgi:uncharacterized tellurite resistance protein B-like protein